MNKQPNKLIKKILNLKEDYTLNLEEGREDEDLTVLRESITEKEYNNITEAVQKHLISEMSKELQEVSIQDRLHKFVKNYFNRQPGQHSLHEGKEFQELAKLYEGNFENFKEDFIEGYLKREYNKVFAESYKKAHAKEGTLFVAPIQKDYAKEGIQILVGNEPRKLSEEFWGPFLGVVGGYYKNVLNEAKKVFEEADSSSEPQEPVEQNSDNPDDGDTENQIIQNISPVLSVVNLGTYQSSNLIPAFDIDEAKINDLCEQHIRLVEHEANKPEEIYKSFHVLLDKLVEAFKIEDNENIQKFLATYVNNITDADENNDTLNEAVLREDDEDNNVEGTEGGTSAPLDAKEEANKKIQELITNKQFAEVQNLLTQTNNYLPTALAILRLLVVHSDIFGTVGDYFAADDALRKDVKDLYAYYLLVILNEHFHAIFQAYDDDKRNVLANVGALDAETAKSFLKKFRALVNNTKENAYSGALQAFIGANDLTEKAAGYLMHIRSALTSTLKAVHDLVVADMKLNSEEELIRWRRKDCKAAHDAFDEQLKASLADCFKKVLEGTFEINTKNGETVKVPIRNYMFDVEIPRRFKKALNVKNAQFEEFINEYYSEDVEKEIQETSPKLVNYFGKVAKKKQDKSLEYVEHDAQVASEEVDKEDKDENTIKDFSASIGADPERVKASMEGKDPDQKPEDENPTPSEEGSEGSEAGK